MTTAMIDPGSGGVETPLVTSTATVPWGPPVHPRRRLIDGVRWRVRVGAPWRDVPERYGPWQTVYSFFRRWQLAGAWAYVVTALQARADARGLITWEVSAKLHLSCEQGRRLMSLLLTGGQRDDSPQFTAVLERVRVPRLGPGRPRTGPDRVLADRAYAFEPEHYPSTTSSAMLLSAASTSSKDTARWPHATTNSPCATRPPCR